MLIRAMALAAITDLQAANFVDHGKWRGRKGYFISRNVAVFIAFVCVCTHVVTGLVVFYCLPRYVSSQLEAADMNLRPLGTGNHVTPPSHKALSSNRLPTHVIPTHYRSEVKLLVLGLQQSVEVKTDLAVIVLIQFQSFQHDEWIKRKICIESVRELTLFYLFHSLFYFFPPLLTVRELVLDPCNYCSVLPTLKQHWPCLPGTLPVALFCQ